MKPYRPKLESERIRSSFPEPPAPSLSQEAHDARRERIASQVQIILEPDEPQRQRTPLRKLVGRLFE